MREMHLGGRTHDKRVHTRTQSSCCTSGQAYCQRGCLSSEEVTVARVANVHLLMLLFLFYCWFINFFLYYFCNLRLLVSRPQADVHRLSLALTLKGFCLPRSRIIQGVLSFTGYERLNAEGSPSAGPFSFDLSLRYQFYSFIPILFPLLVPFNLIPMSSFFTRARKFSLILMHGQHKTLF